MRGRGDACGGVGLPLQGRVRPRGGTAAGVGVGGSDGQKRIRLAEPRGPGCLNFFQYLGGGGSDEGGGREVVDGAEEGSEFVFQKVDQADRGGVVR